MLSSLPAVGALNDNAELLVKEDKRPSRLGIFESRRLQQIQLQQLSLYQDKIAAQESLYDTYNTNLSESLTGLGKVQEKLGRYTEAVNTYRRAMHIQRVNNGIYSLSQEPMLRGIMNAYEGMGDMDNANKAYDSLQRLYLRNYEVDDPKLVAMLKEKGEWHLLAYQKHPDRTSLYHLGYAYRLMMRALNLASAETPAGQVTLLPLWRNLAVANFLLADHGRRYPVGQREGFRFATSANADMVQVDPLSADEALVVNSYRGGLYALENIALYHFNNPGSSIETRVKALADLGDWHLIFGKYLTAGKVYKEAWAAAEADKALQSRLFEHPAYIPPAGVTRTSVPAPSADYPYVLAKLHVNNRGRPRDISIVESYPETDESIKDTAYQVLRGSRFRPPLANGEMVASSEFTYRLEIAP